jgi:hypothetical protein
MCRLQHCLAQGSSTIPLGATTLSTESVIKDLIIVKNKRKDPNYTKKRGKHETSSTDAMLWPEQTRDGCMHEVDQVLRSNSEICVKRMEDLDVSTAAGHPEPQGASTTRPMHAGPTASSLWMPPGGRSRWGTGWLVGCGVGVVALINRMQQRHVIPYALCACVCVAWCPPGPPRIIASKQVARRRRNMFRPRWRGPCYGFSVP